LGQCAEKLKNITPGKKAPGHILMPVAVGGFACSDRKKLSAEDLLEGC
jgi:hypothetical protein